MVSNIDYDSTPMPSDAERLRESLHTLRVRIDLIDKKVTRMLQVLYAILAIVVLLLFGVARS